MGVNKSGLGWTDPLRMRGLAKHRINLADLLFSSVGPIQGLLGLLREEFYIQV